MNWASVCSGIGAPEMAWKYLPDWNSQWVSEIEPFPSKVLKHYYPDVPNLGDMTKLSDHEHYNKSTIDLLAGGTPCQSFSIAGLRGGLDDERGNLALEFCRILVAKLPKWFVWENVPGVFSSFSNDIKGTIEFKGKKWALSSGVFDITKSSDFATLLTAFRECGYSVSYRIFDSKYFGVPQRRRRVFVVGHLGNDWRPSTAVLFERDSLRRDFTPGKEKRKRASGTTEESIRSYGINSTAIGRQPANGGNGLGISNEVAPTLTKMDKHGVASFGYQNEAIGIVETELSGSLKKNGTSTDERSVGAYVTGFWWDGTQIAHTLTKNSANGRMPDHQNFQGVIVPGVPYVLSTGQSAPKPQENESPTLTRNHEAPILFQPKSAIEENWEESDQKNATLVCPTLTRYNLDSRSPQSEEQQRIIAAVFECQPFQVRRLTPLECGRLQGFPDGYGNIPGSSDTALYAAFGNSMTVHVMKWIGERIDKVDKILKSLP